MGRGGWPTGKTISKGNKFPSLKSASSSKPRKIKPIGGKSFILEVTYLWNLPSLFRGKGGDSLEKKLLFT